MSSGGAIGVPDQIHPLERTSSLASIPSENSTHLLSVPWVDDKVAPYCHLCMKDFHVLRRRHHCRFCGKVFCDKCSNHRLPIGQFDLMLMSGAGNSPGNSPKEPSLEPDFAATSGDADGKGEPLVPSGSNSSGGSGANIIKSNRTPKRSPARRPESPHPTPPQKRESSVNSKCDASGDSLNHSTKVLSRPRSNTTGTAPSIMGSSSPNPKQKVRVCATCYQLCRFEVETEWDLVTQHRLVESRSTTAARGGGSPSPARGGDRRAGLNNASFTTQNSRGGSVQQTPHHQDPQRQSSTLTSGNASVQGLTINGSHASSGGTATANKEETTSSPVARSTPTLNCIHQNEQRPDSPALSKVDTGESIVQSPLHIVGLPDSESIDPSWDLVPVTSADLVMTDSAAAHHRGSGAAPAQRLPQRKRGATLVGAMSLVVDTARESTKVIKGATAGVLGASASVAGAVTQGAVEGTVGKLRSGEDLRSKQTREHEGVLVWGGKGREDDDREEKKVIPKISLFGAPRGGMAVDPESSSEDD